MFEFKQRYILKAALQLFMSYGVKAVTMEEIANQAGVSKKTIYQYFKDKNELVDTVYARIINIIRKRIVKITASKEDAITAYIKMVELSILSQIYFSPATVDDLKRFFSSVYKKLEYCIEKKYSPAITGCIDDGKKQGLIETQFNSQLMAMTCIAQLEYFLWHGTKKIPALSSIELKEQLLRQLLYGMVTTAGKKITDNHLSNNK